MVLRNSLYNMLGLGLPLVVAIATIPALIEALGVVQFGILTLIWAVVSYFGLFDLGLGRAVTQQVAIAIKAGDTNRIRHVVGSSTVVMAALGLFGGVVMFFVAPVFARELAQQEFHHDVVGAFWWMAAAMPAIVLTSGYRGILEAVGSFRIINIIRLPMGIFTYAGPLGVVVLGFNDLTTISAALCVGRVAACVVHAYYAMRALPDGIGLGHFERGVVGELLRFGGWLSVSNVISPIMSYVDRFVIGFLVSASAVAYYATPQELVLRIGIVPAAIVAVLFPLFAAEDFKGEGRDARGYIAKYSVLMAAIVAPFSLVIAAFANGILSWWISSDFAAEAGAALQIMALAALLSGIAQVPFTMLQGRGKADLTAKLHLIELPVYLGILYILVIFYGVVGAALAWLLRIAADTIAMYVLCWRCLNSEGVDAPHVSQKS